MSAAELVDLMAQRVQEIFGVQDTAQVLAEDVVERTDADAAVVLVPDGSQWRVSGGVGLRPIERRLTLSADHWLIQETIGSGHGLIVEDTDTIRTKIAGAPLAAWKQLLAVPVSPVSALIVLARGQEARPFAKRDLSTVLPVAREASVLLDRALRTRALARMLAPMCDDEAGT